MARKTYPDPAIERAVREVRRIRDELSLVYAELEELAEKAGTGGSRESSRRVARGKNKRRRGKEKT